MLFSVSSTVTVTGKVPQVICCQHCGKEFLYFMQQSGSVTTSEQLMAVGLAAAERRAEEAARHQLATRLRADNYNAVPCRHCFRFQPFMRREATQKRFGDKNTPAMVVIGVGAVIVATGAVMAWRTDAGWTTLLTTLGIGFAILLLGWWIEQRFRHRLATYDPNDQPEEERAEIAKQRCMTWDEFNLKQAKRVSKQYRRHIKEQKRERWLNSKTKSELPPPVRLWLPPQAFADGVTMPLGAS